MGPSGPRRVTRRTLLAGGFGAIVAAGVAGVELVDHRVLPGKWLLNEITGACSVASPALTFAAEGPTSSGRFYSVHRRRSVGYSIAYPPGHGSGSRLPFAVSLHGFGGDHRAGLGGITLTRALAARQNGRPLPPMALVSIDGGGSYWNPHPGDDPVAMIIHELIPMCRRLGLGRSPRGIGVIGISMGGYGALLLGEKHLEVIAAVAAISPAVWTTYQQARAVNAGAFASAADFDSDNVITHASALAKVPTRISSGNDDPFHPGVVALSRALPRSVVMRFADGCHDGAFFGSQQHASLRFLGEHLAGRRA